MENKVTLNNLEQKVMTLGELADLRDVHYKLNTRPDYQREFVWGYTPKRCNTFWDSFLSGADCNVITLWERSDADIIDVVDGQQRLCTCFDKLLECTPEIREKARGLKFRVSIIKNATREMVVDYYRTINDGVALNNTEKRKDATTKIEIECAKLIKKKSEFFNLFTDKRHIHNKGKRYGELECVQRLLSFIEHGFDHGGECTAPKYLKSWVPNGRVQKATLVRAGQTIDLLYEFCRHPVVHHQYSGTQFVCNIYDFCFAAILVDELSNMPPISEDQILQLRDGYITLIDKLRKQNCHSFLDQCYIEFMIEHLHTLVSNMFAENVA